MPYSFWLKQFQSCRRRYHCRRLGELRLLGDPKALCSDTVFFCGMMASSSSMASDEQVRQCWNEVRKKKIEYAQWEEKAIRTCDKHKQGDSDWCVHLAIVQQVQAALLALSADQNQVTDLTRDRPEQE